MKHLSLARVEWMRAYDLKDVHTMILVVNHRFSDDGESLDHAVELQSESLNLACGRGGDVR